ncbi:MAG: YlxR family protein [Vampirovibrionales bacterium]|nr:YlxR family protein [Vampirovibrionales bacterium]
MAIRAQGPLAMPASTTPAICWFMPNEPIGKNQGRSAYLCLDEACLATALKRKSLSRALKCTLPSDMLSKLTANFKNCHYYR